MKTLFKDAFGEVLKTSPAFKHVVDHVTTLAKEAIRVSKLIVDLRHDVNTLAEYVQAHQVALQHIAASQSATLNSMKQQTLDVSMPKAKASGDKKPN